MKRIGIILLVIAVLASSWWLYAQDREPVEAELPDDVTTAQVTRGDIEDRVSATGSVLAGQTETLSFSTSGRVAEVLVEEDQQVVAGQLLARLDVEDLQLNLRQAEAALQVSEAQLARAVKAPTEEEIASAQAAVASAEASLQDLRRGPTARDKELARLAIDQAKNSLWAAQGSRDATAGSPVSSGGQKDQAEAQVLNAEVQVTIAEIRYQQLLEPPKASTVAQAETQLRQAETTLSRLLSQPSPEDIAVAEAQVEQARISVDIARKALTDAGAHLTAPFAGTLVEWDLDADASTTRTVTPNVPVGTLVDTERHDIRVNIDETEIAKLQIGQSVRISLDAFPDDLVTGRVSRIGLVGQSQQGIIVYPVEIEIDANDLPIRPQMTAAVDIVVDSKQSVVLVSNRALRRDQQGVYVEVVENNVPRRVNVRVGVDNDQFTEVLSGLEPGQMVVTSRPRDSLFGGPFGGN
jgi:HlyD family secretion protein